MVVGEGVGLVVGDGFRVGVGVILGLVGGVGVCLLLGLAGGVGVGVSFFGGDGVGCLRDCRAYVLSARDVKKSSTCSQQD